jgi:phosphomannomutase
VIPADLRARAQAWIADDPSPADRAELQALLDAASRAGDSPPEAGARTALADLADRFAGTLQFGTAGLRGAIGAGPNRMNRAVVQAATAGLVRWLRERRPTAAEAGVVVGWDARHRSAQFAGQVAAVLTGAGIHVHMLPGRSPTPLLAFAIRHLSAGAGVMITASHNPPADNGYKLYLGDGAQIVPPVDEQIEAAIRGLGPLADIPLGPADGPLITRHGDEVAQAYLDAVVAASAGAPAAQASSKPATGGAPEGVSPQSGFLAGGSGRSPPRASTAGGSGEPSPRAGNLRVVYTPLHGVAGTLMLRAIERAGYPAPHVVAAQAEPDPDFPTVSFPNPEEPGTLDLALADARRLGADLILASDPDGDRLAVAVPDPAADGGWQKLTGDQAGALLGAFLLDATAAQAHPDERLVATTVVSSTMLSKIAAAAGVRYAETLTGFKWIVRAGDQRPGSRFLLGYEEALGYAVGDVVRDKDGIGAALALLGLATNARSAGDSLLDRWAALEAAYGVHVDEQVTLPTRDPGEIMAGLRTNPPAALGGEPVQSMDDLGAGGDLPPSDVLIFRLPGARVVIRPSGTEPKLKAYLEVTEPAGPRSLASAREAATSRMAQLRAAVQTLLTAPGD